MKWRKLGQIFDTTRHGLPDGAVGYAQSPQALVFDDFVRIYFSTRFLDPQNGKFISHIAYAEYDKEFSQVLRVSQHGVIPAGGLGCFDEHGIFPMNVVRHKGRIFGYTCGWNRRVSVSVDTGIGLAESHDGGLTFDRIGCGPVLGPSLLEPFLVGDGFVSELGGLLHMWYIFGTDWTVFAEGEEPDRTYKIGHATSEDGILWVKEEGKRIMPDRLGPTESQALPTVVQIGETYHMFFCYRQSHDFRQNRDRGYRIGHGSSSDLHQWERDDANPAIEVTPGAWDSDMLCYPHAFACDGRVYLLYNGNEFGRYGFGLAALE